MPARPLRRRTALVAGVLALVASAPAGAQEVRLHDVAKAPVVLGGDGPREVRLPLVLPGGAAQGPRTWWQVRLAYRLRFAPDSGAGVAWVSADTNGRTAASIEYVTRRRAGRLSFRRTLVDLDGQRAVVRAGRRDAVDFTNYLQFAGVRGGHGTWTLRVEQAGDARVEAVEVLGATAVRTTSRSPFALVLDPAVTGGRPVAGRPFDVLVRARDRAGRRVSDAEVVTGALAEGLRQVAARDVPGGRLVRFVARRPGTAELPFAATRGGARASVALAVRVAPAPASGPGAAVTALVLTPGGLWLAAAALRRRRRS